VRIQVVLGRTGMVQSVAGTCIPKLMFPAADDVPNFRFICMPHPCLYI
jgi:hypothetical protein